ncbi:hypothetical protein, partial [Candidatus Erwinia dacicola]|uniref:hypothetical protein n=1 Tax=Candidatus Erwinia dacicola TaxID=252393 RepID=UPI001C9CEFA9
SGTVGSTGSGNICRVRLDMAYHLSVVKIPEEINQQDAPPSSNPHAPQMTITRSLNEYSGYTPATFLLFKLGITLFARGC